MVEQIQRPSSTGQRDWPGDDGAESLLRWNYGQPRLRVEVDKPPNKVPALDADTVDEILLPWPKEHWKEAVRLHRENTCQCSRGFRGRSDHPQGILDTYLIPKGSQKKQDGRGKVMMR